MASVSQNRNQAFRLTLALVIILAAFKIIASFHLLPFMSLTPVARMAKCNCFLYFAYGSNLLKERIHINNPSATMLSVGKLKNYQLDFNHFSQRWQGAAATIVEAPGEHVYGILWEVNNEDLTNLDKQEGVHKGIYRALEVEVETTDGELMQARTYQMIRPLEEDRRPSAVYMNVIIKGARQNGLPEEYIRFLEQIEHNGYSGKVNLGLNLDQQLPA